MNVGEQLAGAAGVRDRMHAAVGRLVLASFKQAAGPESQAASMHTPSQSRRCAGDTAVKLWNLILGVALAGFGLIALVPTMAVAQGKPQEPERLWRVRAEYTYKGDPLVLEFGLACSSIWAGANTHKYSKDMFAGPQLYGVKTSDGKAVVMSTRNFCDTGLYPKEPNGGLTDRFLPMTIVYDDADTLAFGTLYASDEAYVNQQSVLTLPKVTFKLLKPDEFLALQKSGVPNAVRMLSNNFMNSRGNPPRSAIVPGKRPLAGTTCRGKRRVKIPEQMKDYVQAKWPQSRPEYWFPDANATRDLVGRPNSSSFVDWFIYGLASQGRGSGLKRHGGGGADRWSEYLPVYALYPDRWVVNNIWDVATQSWQPSSIAIDIETIGDRARGFMYCYQALPSGTSEHGTRAHASIGLVLTVNGSLVANVIPSELPYRRYVIVERDEYFLVDEVMELGPRGEQIDD